MPGQGGPIFMMWGFCSMDKQCQGSASIYFIWETISIEHLWTRNKVRISRLPTGDNGSYPGRNRRTFHVINNPHKLDVPRRTSGHQHTLLWGESVANACLPLPSVLCIAYNLI
jgi:hypothetical protein